MTHVWILVLYFVHNVLTLCKISGKSLQQRGRRKDSKYDPFIPNVSFFPKIDPQHLDDPLYSIWQQIITSTD